MVPSRTERFLSLNSNQTLSEFGLPSTLLNDVSHGLRKAPSLSFLHIHQLFSSQSGNGTPHNFSIQCDVWESYGQISHTDTKKLSNEHRVIENFLFLPIIEKPMFPQTLDTHVKLLSLLQPLRCLSAAGMICQFARLKFSHLNRKCSIKGPIGIRMKKPKSFLAAVQ